MILKSLVITVVVLFAIVKWGRQFINLLDKLVLSKPEVIQLDMDHSHVSFGDKLMLGSGYFPSLGRVELDSAANVWLTSGERKFILGKAKPNQTSDYPFDFVVQEGDSVQFSYRHSFLPWHTLFEFNFMTGHSPSKKRNAYYSLIWRKSDGTLLRARWKFEQWKYNSEDGWGRWNRVYVIDGGKDDLIDLVIERK
ncbi:MAG TPA: hypothetical protein VL728_05060 [Cyclobacteriaceae bacterium]|jgi:hypothetical protein|nr:hypothetical protein [Cyclobacteriaceae bacterium]